MKPNREYLLEQLKPVINSASVARYIKQARVNSIYRNQNTIKAPKIIKQYPIEANLTQDGKAIEVYGAPAGGRLYLYRYELSEFQPKSQPQTKAPAKSKEAPKQVKKAPAKRTTKTSTKAPAKKTTQTK